MIGFYNYTVILTYIGVAVSMLGMNFACHEQFEFSIVCLAIACVCDAFDGKVARTKKNRTPEMELFGIQIDSLCDLICFGISPVVLSYEIGMSRGWGIIVGIFFVLCGVIRLAYYNVLEEMKRTGEKQKEEKKIYHGLPITTIGVIYPLVFLLYPYLSLTAFVRVIMGMHLVVGVLYITDFRITRPKDGVIACCVVMMVVVLMKILHVF